MNVIAAICNSFSGRHSFASLTWSPGLNERAPVEEAVVKRNRSLNILKGVWRAENKSFSGHKLLISS